MRRLVKVSFPLGFYQLLKVRDLQIACECRGFLGCFVGVKLVLQSFSLIPQPLLPDREKGGSSKSHPAGSKLRPQGEGFREREIERG